MLTVISMAILKYFKRKEPFLLDPEGSTKIPSSSIASANKEVAVVLKVEVKRNHYKSFNEEEKAKITKMALEMGTTKAIRKLLKANVYAGHELKESTVRSWKKV